jgi:hypothetical protein
MNAVQFNRIYETGAGIDTGSGEIYVSIDGVRESVVPESLLLYSRYFLQ